MSEGANEVLASRAFFERLEKKLTQARSGSADSLLEEEARILARAACEHLLTSIENPNPNAMISAIRDLGWDGFYSTSLPPLPSVMRVLGALGVMFQARTSDLPDGRWVLRIGRHGRVTLPEAMLLESGWMEGDYLLVTSAAPNRLSIRKVVRISGHSHVTPSHLRRRNPPFS